MLMKIADESDAAKLAKLEKKDGGLLSKRDYQAFIAQGAGTVLTALSNRHVLRGVAVLSNDSLPVSHKRILRVIRILCPFEDGMEAIDFLASHFPDDCPVSVVLPENDCALLQIFAKNGFVAKSLQKDFFSEVDGVYMLKLPEVKEDADSSV